MTLTLDEAPLVAGRRVWATVDVVNLTPQTVLWQGGGCNFVASIEIVAAAVVNPNPGRAWNGLAGRFKGLAGQVAPAQNGYFVDESFVDKGSVACTADLGINELGPGGQLRMRAAWDGEIAGVPAPPGPAKVTATFPYLGPKRAGVDPFVQPPQPIVPQLVVPVVDAGVRLLSPAEAVDAALADPRFGGWLATSDFAAWQGVGIELAAGSYEVSLTLLINGGPVEGRASVDRVSGVVTSFVTEPAG